MLPGTEQAVDKLIEVSNRTADFDNSKEEWMKIFAAKRVVSDLESKQAQVVANANSLINDLQQMIKRIEADGVKASIYGAENTCTQLHAALNEFNAVRNQVENMMVLID